MAEQQLESAWVQFARFRLDPVTYTIVVTSGRAIGLTASEFRLLYDLISHAGHVRASRDILHAVWGTAATEAATNKLAVYIRRLRQKIEVDPAHPTHIITIRRQGYLFQL
jgi:DNA-binding response OmpR family regulator